MSQKQWFAFDVSTKPENREAIEYGLMEAGALGTETVDSESDVRITGYFASPVDEKKVHSALVDAWRIYNQVPSEIDRVNFKVRAVADRDWLADWKKSWQPVQVGRFIVAPPWLVSVPGAVVSEPRAVATGSSVSSGPLDPIATAPGSDTVARGTDTIVIQINPGMAFGTGTHETTRLCLKAIDEYYEGGSFLDVGTGTGVLAIAAAKCQKPDREGGQLAIGAYDVDADAIEIAKQNAELNGVCDAIDFQVGSVNETTASADFVCANLTAIVIVELLPMLVGATCGRMVLSGILDSQEEMVRSRLAELGITEFEVDRDGEWIAMVI
ncbi:MAG TPA: 50S ribosomal protein L11 methyltransferase [Pyrinomonadaceae bacterium]|nr:50S ribosomal protein L11 methyltransferase [Pyrinomonadaceae bacterium]